MTTIGQRCRIVSLLLPFFATFPAYSMSQKAVHRDLDKMGIAINGEDQVLTRGQTLTLIRGDEVVLRYAILQGSGESPRTLDFVGFPVGKTSKYPDDRNRAIDTSLLRRDKGKSGSLFRIRSRSGSDEHGEIPVTVKDPELVELNLKINGVTRSVGPGQNLSLKREDSFEVESIRTNIAEIDSQVRVAIEPTANPLEGIQINLFYRTYAFASVKVLLHPEGSEMR